jgi:hypothetical protein
MRALLPTVNFEARLQERALTNCSLMKTCGLYNSSTNHYCLTSPLTWQDVASNDATTIDIDKRTPIYEECCKKAIHCVFRFPWFYYRDHSYNTTEQKWMSAKSKSDLECKQRQDVFGEMTVEQFRALDKKKQEQLLDDTYIVNSRVYSFLKLATNEKMEHMLHGKIIALTDSDQDVVDTVEREYVYVATENFRL